MLLLFLFTVLYKANAQTDAGAKSAKIDIVQVMGGYKFMQNNQTLSMAQLTEIMKNNEAATKEIGAARTSNVLATMFGFAGEFMLGYPLGTAIGGGDPNWTLAGVGAGLLVVSFPFTKGYKTRAAKAVEIYNASLSSNLNHKPEWRFGFTGTGIGIGLKATF